MSIYETIYKRMKAEYEFWSSVSDEEYEKWKSTHSSVPTRGAFWKDFR